ncbi:hypothetical protein LZ554_005409 [Drepanopeziza brunnea f. sp. 'monogermtubi']|nr:hypothetical protein LZ554_005409 [Drepanopeziza brunnea f. sp. 'monogermtubi']
MSKPFISTRKFIKWGDAPAGEDTDTLVLTTAGKHFVDIRIYLPRTASEPCLPASSPLPISRLEWGFAGTSNPTPAAYAADGTLATPAHTVWTHWVDSRTTAETRDEGVMYPQASGETMEYGAMINPASGKEETYEECWVDLDAGLVDGEDGLQSWVLRTEDAEKGIRGVMVRVGRYAQAVLRRGGGEFGVARWVWRDAGKGWESVVQIGSLDEDVPRGMLGAGDVKLGQTYEGSGGLQWSCVESFAWSS